jgi:PAS domain S-box-containing protein
LDELVEAAEEPDPERRAALGAQVPVRQSVVRRLKVASHIGCAVCVALGITVLVGWATGSTVLTRVRPGLAPTKPNTALLLVLTGASIWLRCGGSGVRRRRLSLGLGVAVLALASLTLLEHISGWNLHIDEMVFREANAPPTRPSGRMSPVTATNFWLLGFAALLFDVRVRRSRPAEWLALLVALFALVAALGYSYGATSLYKVGPFDSVAMYTTIALAAVSLSILFARPEEGLTRIIASDSSGGFVVRWLLPTVILLQGIVGWVRLHGELAGWYDDQFRQILSSTIDIAGLAGLVLWLGGALARSDAVRRRAVEKLRRNEEDLRITLDSTGDAILSTDAAGRVSRMNPVAEKLTGWSLSEAKQRPVGDVLRYLVDAAQEDSSARTSIARTLEEMGLVGLDHRATLIARDGSTRQIHGTAGAMGLANEARGVVLVFRDQTKEDAAQREREHLYQEAIAAIDARDDFLTIVGHELRGPLSALTLNLEAFLRSQDPKRPKLERCEAARRQARQLADLIGELLDVSRITAGALQLNVDDVDLAAVARRVIERVNAKGEAGEIVLRADEQVLGRWDPVRIEQVVTNLSSNAVKFGERRPIEVTVSRSGDTARLVVEDHGAGIPPEDVGRLFQRFTRLGSVERYGGLGMGLYVACQIVLAHGGTIHADSHLGAGSRFVVELPIVAKKPGSNQSAS